MAVRTRQVKNKRDANGILTGRAGTVYDVNIKYTTPDGQKATYEKGGFLTRKEPSCKLPPLPPLSRPSASRLLRNIWTNG